MRLDPSDLHLSLEYAFLCFEAADNAPARKAEARRIFERIRTSSDSVLRATAETAFQNIDGPLIAGIARWQQALATAPPTFSALYELAQLAEQRDELDLAADSYKRAFQMLPERKSILLELARAENARSNPEGAMAALLAASRGGEMRAAELAKEQLPARYPYVYEFRKALELDPGNDALHRELAYLLLAMSEKTQAEVEFKDIVNRSPTDYMSAVQLGLLYQAGEQAALATPLLRNAMVNGDPATANRARMALGRPPLLEERKPDAVGLDPRALAERSYEAGFFKDAKRYYLAALEQSPGDASIALKLGWTNNLLHDDATALHWFDIARHSSDRAISSEASRAYDNLRPGLSLVRTTLWVYPLFSSRWGDLFGYGQIKTELNLSQSKRKKSPVRPYVSLRFVGDARRYTTGVYPQSLSESAFILGVGVSTRYWRGAMAWFEAGTTVSYLDGSHIADYRGGVSFARTIGTSIASERSGWFIESLADSVFVSRFNNDLLTYSQNRAGYTASIGGFKVQTFWNNNLTFDAKKQYWANFAETGPGFRFHPPGAPPSLAVTLGVIRGVYLRNEGNPGRPNFVDFRAGIWYAFTK